MLCKEPERREINEFHSVWISSVHKWEGDVAMTQHKVTSENTELDAKDFQRHLFPAIFGSFIDLVTY